MSFIQQPVNTALGKHKIAAFADLPFLSNFMFDHEQIPGPIPELLLRMAVVAVDRIIQEKTGGLPTVAFH